MNMRNNQNLLYSLAFFILSIINYLEQEYVICITTIMVSFLLGLIYLIFRYEAKKQTMILQPDK